MPLESGASSTPQLISSNIDASGILDRPPSRAMTREYGSAFALDVPALNVLGTVIARSERDEAIQTVTVEKFWIALLSLAMTA
jgi:hypothetical protein